MTTSAMANATNYYQSANGRARLAPASAGALPARCHDLLSAGEAPASAGAPEQPPVRRTVMQITWSLVAGGAEMYALTVASNLDRERFRPLMCGIDQGGALEPDIRRLGIPYTIMNRRPGIELGLMWRLYRLLRRERVDVIHTHHFNQLFYSLLAAKLVGARIIHTEHSIEVYKKRRFRVALRLLSLFCDKLTVIGAEGESWLRDRVGIPSRTLQVIRAGVKTAAYDQQSRAQARQELGLADEARVACIVARLYPEKNHRLLLEAFEQVVRQLPQARLLIVGDGTERQAILDEIERRGLGQHVQVMGVRRDVARILAASDLFVLCSDREGLPIAVLEAMAASRPVVATAVGDLPKVVHDRQNGRLVPPNDAHALGEALLEVLSEAHSAARMGQRGRSMVQGAYGIDRMVARHVALYQPKEASGGSARLRRRPGVSLP